jgi:hypothetical protein
MKPKTIRINGREFRARPMREGEAAHGALLRDRNGRNVYRYLCDDGAEAVLRNVRRPERFEAWDASRLARDFLLVEM